MKSFGSALKEIRELSGVSIQDIKGINLIKYLQYENDELEIDMEVADLLAKAIGSSLTEVVYRMEKDDAVLQMRERINQQLFRATYSEGRSKIVQELSEMVEGNQRVITEANVDALRKSITIMSAIDNREVSPFLEKMGIVLWDRLEERPYRDVCNFMIQINLIPILSFERALSLKEPLIAEAKNWHGYFGTGWLDQRIAIEIGKIQEQTGDLEGARDSFRLAIKSADDDEMDGYFSILGRYYCHKNDFLCGEGSGDKIDSLISALRGMSKTEAANKYEADWRRTQLEQL